MITNTESFHLRPFYTPCTFPNNPDSILEIITFTHTHQKKKKKKKIKSRPISPKVKKFNLTRLNFCHHNEINNVESNNFQEEVDLHHST